MEDPHMSSRKAEPKPLEKQPQQIVEFTAPHMFRGEVFMPGDTVTTGANAAKKLGAAGHKIID